MTRDASPILDRHVQDQIGGLLRERLEDARGETSSDEIEHLLASLRSADDGRGQQQPRRN